MKQQRWRDASEWPLAAAALAFLVAYTWEVIAQPEGAAAVVVDLVIWTTWAAFLIDYIVNLALAPNSWRWFYTHLLDLAIVVLPMLRPLRLLRLVTILGVLHRSAGSAFRGKVILYVAGAALLLIYVAALAVLDAERGSEGGIQTFGQGLWWAFVTITTVGYGDYFPVTPTGQLVAVGVMLGGIALIGVVTATLASWIVEQVGEGEAVEQPLAEAELVALRYEIVALRERLDAASEPPRQE